ncbi:MAG: enoyl-CoA hydratase [Chloroflexi bacterium]|nr:enoyl-CoA hydratase [Chloroflexota bacterium]
MTYTFITASETETITEIRLNRPEKRNALTYEMIAELTAAFTEAGDSDAWGIILNASGRVFCAGHDFADMLDQDLAHMRKLMSACSRLMQLIHAVPQPVIASVQGAAIGAGCQLALSCDMVVASEQAAFRTPGGAGGWFCFTPMAAVTRAIGRHRALEMLMTGEPVPAEQASAWGMVNRVVPADALAAATRELITKATRGSRALKGMGKRAFYTQIELDEARAYQYAAEMMAVTGIMPDPQERMRAFAEKRAPRLNR